MIVKVCGLTSPEDARFAATAGATHVGVVHWGGSKRGVISEKRVRMIFDAARQAGASPVLVLVDHPDPAGVAQRTGAGVVQLHGNEQPSDASALAQALPVWRALRVTSGTPADYAVSRARVWLDHGASVIVLDAHVAGVPGGTGVPVDLGLAQAVADQHPVVLAGGLRPDNVRAAIHAVLPHGVDVASGTEATPGVKAPERVRTFIDEARSALAEIDTGASS